MKKRMGLGLGLFLCISFWAQAQTWDPAKRLSGKGSAWGGSIAARSSNVHVVWIGSDPLTYAADLYYSRSTNSGAIWSAAKRLTWNRDVDETAIGVSATAVHILYVDNGYLKYKKSADNGATWSTRQLNWSLQGRGPAQMVVSGNFIHVVFSAEGAAAPYRFLYYKRSTDNGATWSAPRKLMDVGLDYNAEYSGYSIAASGANVHVVCLNDVLHTPHLDMYYRRSTDNGATWSGTPIQLASLEIPKDRTSTDSPYSARAPSIIASGAKVHLFYVSLMGYYKDSGVFHMRSTNYGLTWGSGSLITNPDPAEEYFINLGNRASAANMDNVYVAYIAEIYDGVDYVDEVLFRKSTDGGITWSAPSRVTQMRKLYDPVSLVYLPGTGYFHLVFVFWDYSTYEDQLYYVRGK
jgi:hypothetical protein